MSPNRRLCFTEDFNAAVLDLLATGVGRDAYQEFACVGEDLVDPHLCSPYVTKEELSN